MKDPQKIPSTQMRFNLEDISQKMIEIARNNRFLDAQLNEIHGRAEAIQKEISQKEKEINALRDKALGESVEFNRLAKTHAEGVKEYLKYAQLKDRYFTRSGRMKNATEMKAS